MPLSVYRVADRVQNLTASVQSVVPVLETRLLVVYNLNTAAALADESGALGGPGRFEIQLNQSLPFLAFTNARWEALVAVRNMFYDAVDGASVYDETARRAAADPRARRRDRQVLAKPCFRTTTTQGLARTSVFVPQAFGGAGVNRMGRAGPRRPSPLFCFESGSILLNSRGPILDS